MARLALDGPHLTATNDIQSCAAFLAADAVHSRHGDRRRKWEWRIPPCAGRTGTVLSQLLDLITSPSRQVCAGVPGATDKVAREDHRQFNPRWPGLAAAAYRISVPSCTCTLELPDGGLTCRVLSSIGLAVHRLRCEIVFHSPVSSS